MEPLSETELRRLLGKSRFGHLALAREGRAYCIPLYFGFDGQAFYFHSQPGMKDDFIEATREACFAVESVQTDDDWQSVLAFGPVEECLDDRDRLRAMEVLLSVPMPPAWGVTELEEPKRADRPRRFYKLVPRRLSGRKSTPAPSQEELALEGM